MPWQETLRSLRQELDETRPLRQQRLAEDELRQAQQRQELTDLLQSLGIVEMLTDMNNILLDGAGELDLFNSWDEMPDDDEYDLSEEGDFDGVTASLTWEEGEDEMNIEVFLMRNEDGITAQVNEFDVRLERAAFENSLVQSFREEMEL